MKKRSKNIKRIRDYGIKIGILETGKNNNITDVHGVKVGHVTLIRGDNVRTGATAIVPHSNNIYQNKIPAAIYIGNGFGKLTGFSQVKELGNIETPIILTNTLSVPQAIEALITYTINIVGNEKVESLNAVVGETNDGWLNDIRGRYLKEKHFLQAIKNAQSGVIEEGNVGAGTGTVCFGYKGGIGTSSRVIQNSFGEYTVGVLVQSNFGGVLQINGVPIGSKLMNHDLADTIFNQSDGSCMIVVATNAPLSSRSLERLAKRALLGLGKTGGIASNGSGDFIIAFSTYEPNFISIDNKSQFYTSEVLMDEMISLLFLAVIEATEEAILNSLFVAKEMMGKEGRVINSLPIKQVIDLMRKHSL